MFSHYTFESSLNYSYLILAVQTIDQGTLFQRQRNSFDHKVIHGHADAGRLELSSQRQSFVHRTLHGTVHVRDLSLQNGQKKIQLKKGFFSVTVGKNNVFFRMEKFYYLFHEKRWHKGKTKNSLLNWRFLIDFGAFIHYDEKITANIIWRGYYIRIFSANLPILYNSSTIS